MPNYDKQYPSGNFPTPVDELGYDVTIEILNLQRVHFDPIMARDRMRALIEEFRKVVEDRAYYAGMDAGLALGKLADD